MKKLLPGLALLGVLLGGAFSVRAETVESLPSRPAAFLSDYADLIPSDVRLGLEAELVALEKETGAELAVVTVANLGGSDVNLFAVELFKKWGIGKEKEDNGILFLIARDERKMRIEVGYGLEGQITDGTAGAILDQSVVPFFREGKYAEGVVSGVDEITRIVRGGTPPVPEEDSDFGGWANLAGWAIIIFFNTAFATFGFMARSKSFWFGGVVGAIVGFFFGLVFGYYFIFIPAYILLGLFLDFILSRYASSWTNGRGGGPGSFWTGGGFGGKGGGGGFGGFGGGSSGGGGASRGW